MPDKHALLGPSGANKWLNCPPSARLEENIPEKPSPFAAEGTVAHTKGEQKINNAKDGHGRRKVKCDDKEMDEATTDYMNYVLEVWNGEKAKCPDAQLFVEVQEDLSTWIPDGFGTSDAVIVSDDTLHVIDLKYGKGVAVSATDNPQLQLYAAGAMEIYEMLYSFEKIKLHIFQPRIDNINTAETTKTKLKAWLNDVVRPAAEKAYRGAGETNPGAWCKFCKVKGQCKKRAEKNKVIAEEKDMMKALLLTDEEIAGLLPQLKEIQEWCKDLQEFALDQAMQGTRYAGYKLVEGTSRRKIVAPEEAQQKLEAEGYTADQITTTKLKTITELEKLVGKKEFTALVGEYIEKPPGAPTLVPESDKRPELKEKVAMDAWAEELGEGK